MKYFPVYFALKQYNRENNGNTIPLYSDFSVPAGYF